MTVRKSIFLFLRDECEFGLLRTELTVRNFPVILGIFLLELLFSLILCMFHALSRITVKHTSQKNKITTRLIRFKSVYNYCILLVVMKIGLMTRRVLCCHGGPCKRQKNLLLSFDSFDFYSLLYNKSLRLVDREDTTGS